MEACQLTVYLFLMIINQSIIQISGQSGGTKNVIVCDSTSGDIDFIVDLNNEGYDTKSWYFNSLGTKIAQQIGTGNLSIEAAYNNRVSLYGPAGITLRDITQADAGKYILLFVTDATNTPGTATSTVNVLVSPNASCIPEVRTRGIFTLGSFIPENVQCPAKDLSVFWNDEQTASNFFTCVTVSEPTFCARRASGNQCYNGRLCSSTRCTGYLILLTLLFLLALLILYLICNGNLDCCKCCRIFEHHKESKSCYVTWYCSAKRCCSFFYCRPGSTRGKFFCGHKSEKEHCGGCHFCLEKCGCGWPGFCKSKDPRSCGCCFCICCVPGLEDEGLAEVLTEEILDLKTTTTKYRPPAVHFGAKNNKVISENASNHTKTFDLHQPLPSLGGKLDRSNLRPQPTPPGRSDFDTTQYKLPPLQTAKQSSVNEEVGSGKKTKKKNKQQE